MVASANKKVRTRKMKDGTIEFATLKGELYQIMEKQ